MNMNALKNNCVSFRPINQFKPEPASLASRLVMASVCAYWDSPCLQGLIQNCQVLLKSQGSWEAVLLPLQSKLVSTGTCASPQGPLSQGFWMMLWVHCWGKARLGETGYVCAWDLALPDTPGQGHLPQGSVPCVPLTSPRVENSPPFSLLLLSKGPPSLLSTSKKLCINSLMSLDFYPRWKENVVHAASTWSCKYLQRKEIQNTETNIWDWGQRKMHRPKHKLISQ